MRPLLFALLVLGCDPPRMEADISAPCKTEAMHTVYRVCPRADQRMEVGGNDFVICRCEEGDTVSK